MTEVVVALDVGGTSIKCALVDRAGEVLVTRRVPTGRDRGPDAVVETILSTAADLTAVDGYTPRGTTCAPVVWPKPGSVVGEAVDSCCSWPSEPESPGPTSSTAPPYRARTVRPANWAMSWFARTGRCAGADSVVVSSRSRPR